MSGGGSADTFVFGIPEMHTLANADVITDFLSSEGDKIALYSEAFGFKKVVFKNAKNKKQLKKLYSKKANLIHYTPKSWLIVDLNGKAPGLEGGGVLAIFENDAQLNKNSFEVLAGSLATGEVL
jgi:hypothetical protein